MKDKTSAALLAFFLGAFGVHRFYLGQTAMGVFYLLFFWTFIPAIIAFIDFICFLVMSDADFDRKYNKQKSINNSNVSSADEIAKLHKLMRDGIITEDEFNRKKAQYL